MSLHPHFDYVDRFPLFKYSEMARVAAHLTLLLIYAEILTVATGRLYCIIPTFHLNSTKIFGASVNQGGFVAAHCVFPIRVPVQTDVIHYKNWEGR